MSDIYPLEKFYIYFSPYTSHAISLDGVTYPTIEHAYHCLRYSDKKIIEEIKCASSPKKAWEISSRYKNVQVPNFNDKKLSVMKKLMILKVLQHEDVRLALLDSGNLRIVKHIVTPPKGDGFWDDGEDGLGLNHTGKLWMEIRNELRAGTLKPIN